MIKPWTSRPAVIDALLKLVDAVTKVATDNGGNNTGKDVVDMLPELATLLFACLQERLDWLARQVPLASSTYFCSCTSRFPSPMAANDPNSQSDRGELEDKFAQLRPEVLETLRTLLSEQLSLKLFSKGYRL